MRRSILLQVTVLCPHFERPVVAHRDTVSERLVDCNSKRECSTEEERSGTKVTVYPESCPVFRPRT